MHSPAGNDGSTRSAQRRSSFVALRLVDPALELHPHARAVRPVPHRAGGLDVAAADQRQPPCGTGRARRAPAPRSAPRRLCRARCGPRTAAARRRCGIVPAPTAVSRRYWHQRDARLRHQRQDPAAPQLRVDDEARGAAHHRLDPRLAERAARGVEVAESSTVQAPATSGRRHSSAAAMASVSCARSCDGRMCVGARSCSARARSPCRSATKRRARARAGADIPPGPLAAT